MLEKCNSNENSPVYETPFLEVSRIHPDTTFECFAYVQGGQHKFTKTGKPFITLYLRDVEGVVIPGYVFDIQNFKTAGVELTAAIHSVVKLKVTENYLPRYGMSVIVNSISIVGKPSLEMTRAFVGSIGDVNDKYNALMDAIKTHLGIKVTLPYGICTSSYMDYYQGRIGGQCLHYFNMMNTLDVWASSMTLEESHQLFATFVLYVFVHNNYLAAVESGNDDISLVNTLTTSVSRYMKTLKVGTGASEVIHLFFGYEPKDLFVRYVHLASEINLRTMKELGVFRALPITREGDAGYGTIKRYPVENT